MLGFFSFYLIVLSRRVKLGAKIMLFPQLTGNNPKFICGYKKNSVSLSRHDAPADGGGDRESGG
jgi:hypothetical protein